MPGRAYSESQKKSIETDGVDLAVSAGPGSGKTSVLVERFLHTATARDIDPERILAITFTEKAAQEMKTRLVRACRSRGLSELLKRIENAPVSTIDSFCAKLLKENPIEAGVDPYFQILGEGEAEILKERLLDDLFQSESSSELWLKLLVEIGEDPMRSLLKSYYTQTRSRLSGAALLSVRDHEEARLKTEGYIEDFVHHIIAETERPDLKDTEAGMRAASKEILGMLKCVDLKYDRALFGRIAALAKKMQRKGRLKDTAAEVRPLIEYWLQCLVSRIAGPLKLEFIRVYRLFEAAYDTEKRRLAAYDFTDLLFKAYGLLSAPAPENKALCAYYREFYSHILVDEYQDTSPLQASLIGLLKRSDNLFVVGDLKQSIYSFRQAEPQVMRDRVETSHAVTLSENYRSRPEILRWVNEYFAAAYPAERFEPLKAMRRFKIETDHAVELLCVTRGEDSDESADEARVTEAGALAARIRTLVKSGAQVQENDGALRPIRYGDIVLLLRSTAGSAFYEKALSDLGVPYFVVKGKGFYGKPEIKDLLHFLKWLENPDLDISLACILRSPLFGLSDDGLFWISRAAKAADDHAPLFTALKEKRDIQGLSQADRERLDDFVLFGARMRAGKNRYKISELLEAAVRETSYEAKLLTETDGRRKIANIRKLIDMARAAEENNIFGVGDFVRYLESLADRETAEEEAKIDPEEGDAVVISSIHSAKGLEFPCVITADLGRKPNTQYDPALISSEKEGMGFKYRVPGVQKSVPDVSYTQIKAEQDLKRQAEESRLLYVAMTRAKELLILSGSTLWNENKSEPKNDGSWMQHLLKTLDLDPRGAGSLDFRGVSVHRLKAAAPVLRGSARRSSLEGMTAEMRSRILSGAKMPAEDCRKLSIPYDCAAASAIESRLTLPLKPYSSFRDSSVTELLSREKGSGEPDRPYFGFSDEDGLPRNEFGTLYHRIMEISVLRLLKGGTVTASFLAPLTRGLNAAEKKEINSSVLKFWKSPQGKAVLSAKKCYPELPFIYKTPHGLLKGQIDLAYQTRSGAWHILDYKTNQITAAQVTLTASEYEFQLGLYALVFEELYGQMPAKGILYFSSINKTYEFSYNKGSLEAIQERLAQGFAGLAAGNGL